MSETGPTIPKSLIAGLNSLGSLASCRIGKVRTLQKDFPRWELPVEFTLSHTSEFISRITKCYALISKDYPYGKIVVCPAVDGGFRGRFPHQLHDTSPPSSSPWSGDRLCLEEPFGQSITTSPSDPVGNRDLRLLWYINRAFEWLQSAAQGCLVRDGDPFELPLFRSLYQPTIVFSESERTFKKWSELIGEVGKVTLTKVRDLPNTLYVLEFRHMDDELIHMPLEVASAEHEDVQPGYWWLWPRTPVLEPWSAPTTWGDLRFVGRRFGIDVDTMLRKLARQARGKRLHILLLGYPIPLRWGNKPQEITWQAITLPELRLGMPLAGFRHNENGWWHRDRREILGDANKVIYLKTDNWHADRLQARGRLPEELREMTITIIGLGSLGSIVANLLARAGCTRFVLIDDDSLVAGNVVRHVLTLSTVGIKKVESMKVHLQNVNPFVSVKTVEDKLPSSANDIREMLEESDVIIDCTASDTVHKLLSLAWWSVPRYFLSFSVGYRAQRFFAFGCYGNQFNETSFTELLSPILAIENAQWSKEPELLEGAGCWSPLFPARIDDMESAGAACIKILEGMILRKPTSPELHVFEHKYDHGVYMGFCCSDSDHKSTISVAQ